MTSRRSSPGGSSPPSKGAAGETEARPLGVLLAADGTNHHPCGVYAGTDGDRNASGKGGDRESSATLRLRVMADLSRRGAGPSVVGRPEEGRTHRPRRGVRRGPGVRAAVPQQGSGAPQPVRRRERPAAVLPRRRLGPRRGPCLEVEGRAPPPRARVVRQVPARPAVAARAFVARRPVSPARPSRRLRGRWALSGRVPRREDPPAQRPTVHRRPPRGARRRGRRRPTPSTGPRRAASRARDHPLAWRTRAAAGRPRCWSSPPAPSASPGVGATTRPACAARRYLDTMLVARPYELGNAFGWGADGARAALDRLVQRRHALADPPSYRSLAFPP